MFVSRVLFRASKNLPESSLLVGNELIKLRKLPTFCRKFRNFVHETSGSVGVIKQFASPQVSLLRHLAFNPFPFQRFGISSMAYLGPANQTEERSNSNSAKFRSKPRRRHTKRTAFSDSDSESDEQISRDDLVKLVAEKEELLKSKHKEIKKMQDKVLRSYAEMENVMDRTGREAENSKKFAIQNFAKSLLDVADNLGRASFVVKDSFAKINVSEDSSGAMPLLKTLLEGVEMTEKQLLEVFKKSGVEKYDPANEPFDPHRHNAAFQISDASKPPGTVAIVLKSGYLLYDRVLRPAEVGVTQELENNPTDRV